LRFQSARNLPISHFQSGAEEALHLCVALHRARGLAGNRALAFAGTPALALAGVPARGDGSGALVESADSIDGSIDGSRAQLLERSIVHAAALLRAPPHPPTANSGVPLPAAFSGGVMRPIAGSVQASISSKLLEGHRTRASAGAFAGKEYGARPGRYGRLGAPVGLKLRQPSIMAPPHGRPQPTWRHSVPAAQSGEQPL
jgi:hypothetical protein